MASTGKLIASIAAGKAHDSLGNANIASTSTDNTVQFILAAKPTFRLTAPTSGTYNVGQTVVIAWYDTNIIAGTKISLCYDADKIVQPQRALDRGRSGQLPPTATAPTRWDTTGVAAGNVLHRRLPVLRHGNPLVLRHADHHRGSQAHIPPDSADVRAAIPSGSRSSSLGRPAIWPTDATVSVCYDARHDVLSQGRDVYRGRPGVCQQHWDWRLRRLRLGHYRDEGGNVLYRRRICGQTASRPIRTSPSRSRLSIPRRVSG